MSCHQSGSSACANAPCHLCQLTKGNPVGFTCSCPNSKVLLLDGTCECRFTITLICLCYKCLLPIFGRWIDTHFRWLFYFSVNVINESFFVLQIRGLFMLPWPTSTCWSSETESPLTRSCSPLMTASCHLIWTGTETGCTGLTKLAISNAPVWPRSRLRWSQHLWQVNEFTFTFNL